MEYGKAFLLKTRMCDSETEISRRVLVPETTSVGMLSCIMQLIFEWNTDYHYESLEKCGGRFFDENSSAAEDAEQPQGSAAEDAELPQGSVAEDAEQPQGSAADEELLPGNMMSLSGEPLTAESALSEFAVQGKTFFYEYGTDKKHRHEIFVEGELGEYPLPEARLLSFTGDSSEETWKLKNGGLCEFTGKKPEEYRNWEEWGTQRENEHFDKVKVDWRLQQLYRLEREGVLR